MNISGIDTAHLVKLKSIKEARLSASGRIDLGQAN
jgi:hypothetical protein